MEKRPRSMDDIPQMASTADVSKKLGISEHTICVMARDGLIPAVKIAKRRWYFPVDRLAEWLQNGGDKDGECTMD